jgi:hypothetical protein
LPTRATFRRGVHMVGSTTHVVRRTIKKGRSPKIGDVGAFRFSEFVHRLSFESEPGGALQFPFRRRNPQKHDLIDVQFDKYHRPRFILNFGQVGLDGLIDAYGRYIKVDDVRIYHLVEGGRLNARPRLVLEHWFGVGPPAVRPVESAADLEIEKLIRLFPQVERWFTTGRIGWNLSILKKPENAPGVRKKYMEAGGTWPPARWTQEDEDRLRM